MTDFIVDSVSMLSKTQLTVDYDSRQIFLFFLFCIVSPPAKIAFSSFAGSRRIHFAFIAFSLKRLKYCICLFFKFSTYKINIYAACIRWSVISITCCSLIQQQKRVYKCGYRKGVNPTLNFGVPKKYFLPRDVFIINFQTLLST